MLSSLACFPVQVEVFGSFRTGLFLPASDIDLVVFGCWKIKPLYTLRDELVRRGVCEEGRTTVLDKASVSHNSDLFMFWYFSY